MDLESGGKARQHPLFEDRAQPWEAGSSGEDEEYITVGLGEPENRDQKVQVEAGKTGERSEGDDDEDAEAGEDLENPFPPQPPPRASRQLASQARGPIPLFSSKWWGGSIPVIVVILLICWAYILTAFHVGYPYTMRHYIPGLILEFIYSFLLLMMCWSFLFAVTLDAGTVPRHFLNEQNHEQLTLHRKENGRLRICQHCRIIKPDRTHHCRVCKRCILKMDHHCPWINNCVGFGNYKAFQLFLWYTSVFSFYSCFFIAIAAFPTLHLNNIHFLGIQIICCFILGLLVGFGLAAFGIVHLKMTLENITTIEKSELRSRLRVMIASPSGKEKSSYNVGSSSNFRQVFGSSVFCWFIPLPTSEGDGTTFPVSPIEGDPLLRSPDIVSSSDPNYIRT